MLSNFLKAAEEVAKRQLIEFGEREFEYPDKSRFYLQAPGGQVFRLAPEEGGIGFCWYAPHQATNWQFRSHW